MDMLRGNDDFPNIMEAEFQKEVVEVHYENNEKGDMNRVEKFIEAGIFQQFREGIVKQTKKKFDQKMTVALLLDAEALVT